jgi:GNAT superfamily N-acetyltransferase
MNTKHLGVYDVRDYRPDDKNFVMSTFLRGLYYGDSWFSLIPKYIFMANYQIVGEALIRDGVVKIACAKDDPDIILGYSILSSDYQAIHWVFVKSAWRGGGIGRALVPQYPVAVTNLTTLGKSLMTKFQSCVFNPFYRSPNV